MTRNTHTHNHSPPDDRHTMLWLVEDTYILMHKYISLWFSPYVSDTHRLIRTFEWVCACFCSSSFCGYRFVLWFLYQCCCSVCNLCFYIQGSRMRRWETINTDSNQFCPSIDCAFTKITKIDKKERFNPSHKLHTIERFHTINPTEN